ncbi:MAG: ABC transporter substrate-binding protein [Myxococcales bacterium]|nr:ABC transporter substrate-binding protein [Myxococcales bacterium]
MRTHRSLGPAALAITALAIAALATGCGKKDEAPATGQQPAPATTGQAPAPAEAAPAIKTDKGVDLTARKITIGSLDDESGPGAAIGKPFAIGKKILVAQVNAGGAGLLPDGWTLAQESRDHGYDPGKAQQAYSAIKDDILFIATSFGTPNTLPLRPFLEADGLVAFPASLSSQMAEHAHTPPIGAPYSYEVMRAVDHIVDTAGATPEAKAAIKLGIVYDQTDYGKDGLAGLQKAAAFHGLTLAADRAIKPGQKDFTAEIGALQSAGATHVILTVLPSSTGPLLGTAAALGYAPAWYGNTPAWIDAFFAHPKLPPAVFAHYHWAGGLPYWGEQLPGMDKFIAAYEAHGKDLARPDFYILLSYVQGLVALEAARRAIEQGDITRAGYMKALRTIKDFDGGGLLQPVDLTRFPYVTGTRIRILKPDFDNKTWTPVADYAEPRAIGQP